MTIKQGGKFNKVKKVKPKPSIIAIVKLLTLFYNIVYSVKTSYSKVIKSFTLFSINQDVHFKKGNNESRLIAFVLELY